MNNCLCTRTLLKVLNDMLADRGSISDIFVLADYNLENSVDVIDGPGARVNCCVAKRSDRLDTPSALVIIQKMVPKFPSSHRSVRE